MSLKQRSNEEEGWRVVSRKKKNFHNNKSSPDDEISIAGAASVSKETKKSESSSTSQQLKDVESELEKLTIIDKNSSFQQNYNYHQMRFPNLNKLKNIWKK